MKVRRHWTPAQIALLRALYPDLKAETVAREVGRPIGSVYQKAAALGLRKSAEFLASDSSARIQRGKRLPAMVAHQFQRGMTPWNKGAKGSTGVHENCRATQFQPGSKPHTTLPVGSYRINRDGHLQRKVGEASGSNSKRWRCVAELVWVAAHGPLPPKHIVIFKLGKRTAVLEEITLDRIECISQAENARRNHPRNKSPELARLVQLKGAITRQVNRITRETQEQHP